MNKKSMKVKEMADMLGLKKTDSYYLLHYTKVGLRLLPFKVKCELWLIALKSGTTANRLTKR